MSTSCPLDYHGIDHVVLKVTDIARSLDFYTRVLGMALERIIEDAEIYQLRCGRNLIDLEVMPADHFLASPAARGVSHFCVLVRGDFARIVEYLHSEGVRITLGPVELYGATGFGTSVYILDPDDHTLEIKSDHAEHPVRTTLATARAASTRVPVAPRD